MIRDLKFLSDCPKQLLRFNWARNSSKTHYASVVTLYRLVEAFNVQTKPTDVDWPVTLYEQEQLNLPKDFRDRPPWSTTV